MPTVCSRVPRFLALVLAMASPAGAQDGGVDATSCNTLCPSWLDRPAKPVPLKPARLLRAQGTLGPVGSPHVEPPSRRLVRRPAPDALAPARPAAEVASVDGGVTDLTMPLPTPHDVTQMPDMGHLVAVRGAVMVESEADRAANARQRAALMRDTRPPPDRKF